MKHITLAVIVLITVLSCKKDTKKQEITELQKQEIMEPTNKEKAIALLESLETGDQTPVGYINPTKYIQHNPGVADGLEGSSAAFCKPVIA